jgi:hypothetical protein
VSLGYLSEVERGRKEASSELLASICDALGAPLSQVLREVSDGFALAELQNEPAFGVPLEPALAGPAPAERPGAEPATPDSPASLRGAVRLQQPAKAQHGTQRLVMPQRKITVTTAQRLSDPKLKPVALPGTEARFDELGRGVDDMVPV